MDKSQEIAKLTEEKEIICSENETLRADLASKLQLIEDLQMASSMTSTLVGSVQANPNEVANLEKSLNEAEAKIGELLKVKEKFAEISAEKSNLAMNLSEMQQEMNLMSLQTRTATFCALIPVAIVFLAILASYVPFFGTSASTSDWLLYLGFFFSIFKEKKQADFWCNNLFEKYEMCPPWNKMRIASEKKLSNWYDQNIYFP